MIKTLQKKLFCIGCAALLAAALVPMGAWGADTDNSEPGGDTEMSDVSDTPVEDINTLNESKTDDLSKETNGEDEGAGKDPDNSDSDDSKETKTPEDEGKTDTEFDGGNTIENGTSPRGNSDETTSTPEAQPLSNDNGSSGNDGSGSEETISDSELEFISLSTDAIRIPIISKCLICGGTHGERTAEPCSKCGGEHSIDLTVTIDPKSSTGITTQIIAEDSYVYGYHSIDHNVEHSSSVTPGEPYDVTLVSKKTGTTQVAIYGTNDEGIRTTNIAYVNVEVYEAELPKFVPTEKCVLRSDLGTDQLPSVVTLRGGDDHLGHYTMCDYLSLLGACIYEGGATTSNETQFLYGRTTLEGFDREVYSITSSNESIVKTSRQNNTFCVLEPVGIGTATIQFSDIFGNKATIPIEVVDVVADARKNYSLTQKEITISMGDIIDLHDYIKGNSYSTYIVCNPIDWSVAFPARTVNDEERITGLIGKKPGTTTVSLAIVIGNDEGGGVRHIPEMEVAEFATIMVHVKPFENVLAKGSASSAIACDLVGADEKAQKIIEENNLTLTVKPALHEYDLNTEQKEAMLEVVDNKSDRTILLDISLIDESGNVFKDYGEDQLNFISRVALAGELANLDPETISVYYLAEDGGAWPISCWVEDGYLYLVTEHFSTYLVTGKDASTQQSNLVQVGNEASVDDTSKKASTGTASSKKAGTSSGGTSLAQTGDDAGTTLPFAITAALVALSICLLAYRRFNRQH